MSLKLLVDNVSTKISGDLDAGTVTALSQSMTYKTQEYNGFAFVTVEHKLFNRVKQSFPTGLYSLAAQVLDDYNIEYDIVDSRVVPVRQKALRLHEVTPYEFQKQIIDDAISTQRFIIQVATGGGKTVIAAAILAKLNLPAIFVVHTGDLFEQSYDELSRMLKVPIGRIGGGQCNIQRISVVMIQTIHSLLDKQYIPFDEVEKDEMRDDEVVKNSFFKNKQAMEYIKSIGCVIIDECHHLRAESYVTVMKTCKSCFYRGGLSATPFSGDGRDLILQAYAGKVVGQVSASFLIRQGYLVRPKVFYLRGTKSATYKFNRNKYQTIYKKYIVNSEYRNELIVDCVKRLRELKKSVLITVTLKNHGKKLLQMIRATGIDVQFIYGGLDKMERKVFIEQVRQGQLGVIIGTSLADEGLNIPALDSLILAGGGKSPTRMVQRIGRVLRLSPDTGKTEAVVIDFKDNVRYLLGHYKKRRTMCEQETEFVISENFG
jgi:superfamily II DNA or RNA helicase